MISENQPGSEQTKIFPRQNAVCALLKALTWFSFTSAMSISFFRGSHWSEANCSLDSGAIVYADIIFRRTNGQTAPTDHLEVFYIQVNFKLL